MKACKFNYASKIASTSLNPIMLWIMKELINESKVTNEEKKFVLPFLQIMLTMHSHFSLNGLNAWRNTSCMSQTCI